MALLRPGDVFRDVRGDQYPVLELLGEGDEGGLHVVDVVLAHELEVDARLAHRAAGGGLLAARREEEARLRVPRPVDPR